MSESASISTSIAGRYASAVFDLAKDGAFVDGLEKDVAALTAALDDSADLRDVIGSPVYTRDQQSAAIGAVAQRMGLSPTMTNTLALMASKRRLFTLPQLLSRLTDMIAEDKGEMTAEVTAAQALSAEQEHKLAETLASKTGKTVKLNIRVDDSLIGGMIVKLGSKMIDTSVRSRLASLQNAMKEVG